MKTLLLSVAALLMSASLLIAAPKTDIVDTAMEAGSFETLSMPSRLLILLIHLRKKDHSLSSLQVMKPSKSFGPRLWKTY